MTGVAIGFLGGLFGKGGSAIATPLLSLLGFPGFVAVASPLPAAIPSTLVASAEYWRSGSWIGRLCGGASPSGPPRSWPAPSCLPM